MTRQTTFFTEIKTRSRELQSTIITDITPPDVAYQWQLTIELYGMLTTLFKTQQDQLDEAFIHADLNFFLHHVGILCAQKRNYPRELEACDVDALLTLIETKYPVVRSGVQLKYLQDDSPKKQLSHAVLSLDEVSLDEMSLRGDVLEEGVFSSVSGSPTSRR